MILVKQSKPTNWISLLSQIPNKPTKEIHKMHKKKTWMWLKESWPFWVVVASVYRFWAKSGHDKKKKPNWKKKKKKKKKRKPRGNQQ